MSADDVSRLRSEMSELPGEELNRTLSRRLGLDENSATDELDDALTFVEEPEILSGDDEALGSATDLSHAEDADGSTEGSSENR